MNFYGFKDFFKNKELIKYKYSKMTLEEKRNYKRYVYSTSFETEFARDLMWNYLNDGEKSQYNLYSEYISRERKRKR